MCDYCKHSKDMIDEYNSSLSIFESIDGFYHFIVNGNQCKTKVNFCPMCGRKLTTFEVNL